MTDGFGVRGWGSPSSVGPDPSVTGRDQGQGHVHGGPFRGREVGVLTPKQQANISKRTQLMETIASKYPQAATELADRILGGDVRTKKLSWFGAWQISRQAQARQRDIEKGPFLNQDGVQAQLDLLKGKTIRPEVAGRYQHLLTFDHLGRVTGEAVAGARLRASDFEALQRAVIQDLSVANSTAPREARRTESEVVLQFVSELGKAIEQSAGEKKDELKKIMNSFKLLWLSGTMNKDSACARLAKAAEELKAIAPELAKMAEGLRNELAGRNVEGSLTQYHDNFFGRKFETEVVNHLVRHPPASAVSAAAKVGQFLLEHVERACPGDDQRNGFLYNLAEHLKHDVRPWHAETPEVRAFMASPTQENFRAMMLKTESGFDTVKQSWLAVKISLELNFEHLPCPWMGPANENYGQVIFPSRSTETSPLAPFQVNRDGNFMHGSTFSNVKAPPDFQSVQRQTRGFGTQLPHHPTPETPDTWLEGRSVQSGVRVNVHGPRTFERNALLNNQNTVNGASGSTNIAIFLYMYMQQSDATFNVSDAFAGTMMFLSFDGGHSLPESTGTFSSIWDGTKRVERLEDRQARLNSHVTSYSSLSNLFTSEDTQRAISGAVTHAFDSTLQSFSQLHEQRLG